MFLRHWTKNKKKYDRGNSRQARNHCLLCLQLCSLYVQLQSGYRMTVYISVKGL